MQNRTPAQARVVGIKAPERPVWAFGMIVGVAVLVFFHATAAAAQTGARAEILKEGQDEFVENCVACHGADATGLGDLGQKLIKRPRDLTLIARNNGGKFPFWRVFEIIAGEKPVEGHDTMHMPEYIQRMRRDDFKPGYHQAHVRVLILTHYLESIQKE